VNLIAAKPTQQQQQLALEDDGDMEAEDDEDETDEGEGTAMPVRRGVFTACVTDRPAS
jgi:hypothetical protein